MVANAQSDEESVSDEVTGDAIRLSPPAMQQIKNSECLPVGYSSGSIGPSNVLLTFAIAVNRKLRDGRAVACTLDVKLGGVPLDKDTGFYGLFGASPSSFQGESEFMAVGAYLVGKPPHSLLLTEAGHLGGNFDPGQFGLYLERGGKIIHVLQGSGAIHTSGDKLDISSDYVGPNECRNCGTSEHVSIDLDPSAGRFHYTAQAPRSEEMLKGWLEEATVDGRKRNREKFDRDFQAKFSSLSAEPTKGDPEASPQSDSIPDADAGNLHFSKWKTGWVIGAPTDDAGSTICEPYISFDATNRSKEEVENVRFYADFLRPSEKTTFGTGSSSWGRFANTPPLPSGYHRQVVIRDGVGIVYAADTCSYLPPIDFDLRVTVESEPSELHVIHGSINAKATVFYEEGAPGNPASVNP